ncbi:MAG: hypothetical protein ACKER6_00175 [Candidatus Hodgkinia cicadicola]
MLGWLILALNVRKLTCALARHDRLGGGIVDSSATLLSGCRNSLRRQVTSTIASAYSVSERMRKRIRL